MMAVTMRDEDRETLSDHSARLERIETTLGEHTQALHDLDAKVQALDAKVQALDAKVERLIKGLKAALGDEYFQE